VVVSGDPAGAPGRCEKAGARQRSAPVWRWLGLGLITIGSLLLTLLRHEALHVAGVRLTGGGVLEVRWWAGPWTLGVVDAAPALAAGAAAWCVPLVLPYAADGLLIALGLWARRLPGLSPLARWTIVQHAVQFAALDLGVNSAAAVLYPNDWSLLLAGFGIGKYPVLLAIIVLSVACLLAGTREAAAGAPGRAGRGGHAGSGAFPWAHPRVTSSDAGRSM